MPWRHHPLPSFSVYRPGRGGEGLGLVSGMGPPRKSLLVLNEDDDTTQTPAPQHHHALPLLDPLAAAAEEGEYMEEGKQEEEQGTATGKAGKQMLALCFLALVVVGFLNTIFSKLQSLPMASYVNFSNLFVTAAYIPLSLMWVVPAARSGRIPKRDLDMPKKPFMVMGLLDAMAGLMLFYALVQLSVDLANLLQQAAIPISMLISKLLIKVKYSPQQYIGAAIVAMGIAIVLLPHLRSGSDGNVITSAAIMILSCIPMTLSSVYKEIALGERDLDPTYLNLWVAVFQLLASIPLAIPTSYAQGIGITELPRNLWNGLLCYFGVDAVPVPSVNRCAFQGPFYMTTYIFVNFIYNILVNSILKYGSANLLWLALTTRVPITNIASSTLTFLPGHKPMGPADVWGLVVIMAGLIMYRFGHAAWTRFQNRVAAARSGSSSSSSSHHVSPFTSGALGITNTLKKGGAGGDGDGLSSARTSTASDMTRPLLSSSSDGDDEESVIMMASKKAALFMASSSDKISQSSTRVPQQQIQSVA